MYPWTNVVKLLKVRVKSILPDSRHQGAVYRHTLMVNHCWAVVCGVGPALIQHWISVA